MLSFAEPLKLTPCCTHHCKASHPAVPCTACRAAHGSATSTNNAFQQHTLSIKQSLMVLSVL